MAADKLYPPSPEFVAQAHVAGMEAYQQLFDEAKSDPEAFWGRIAQQNVHWFQPWDKVLDDSQAPFYKWFTGGKTNIAYNCVDRHAQTWRKNKAAIIWEGEPGDQQILTYQELSRRVQRFANVLKKLGYKTGDRAIIYMPMVPELPIAMLACARLGIVHSVVFGGFSAEALKMRTQDLEASLVITADGGYRRGRNVRLKDAVDEALLECPSVTNVIVYRRTGDKITMQPGRDHDWEDLVTDMPETCPAVGLDSSIRSTCSTPPARPASPKASSTPPAAIRCSSPPPCNGCSTSRKRTPTGAPPTWAGSRATATSSTGRCWPARPRSCTRAPRTIPSRIASGASATSTTSTSSTLRRPPSGRSSSTASTSPTGMTSPACGCWARSASRSTRPPGSGTTRSSAAVAARSSTPGGRPKPAPS